jgi:hypothetical protein
MSMSKHSIPPPPPHLRHERARRGATVCEPAPLLPPRLLRHAQLEREALEVALVSVGAGRAGTAPRRPRTRRGGKAAGG